MSLRVNGIGKSYPTRSGPLVVLRDISFSLEAGQSLAITGPSGSGKSTLLSILGTLETPTAGHVSLQATNPFTLSQVELAHFRNTKIGFVFQDHYLLPQCTVLENVLIPTLALPGHDYLQPRARELLHAVGLSSRLEHYPA